MNISLFSGCVIPIRFPGMEAATRYLAQKLDLGIVDVEFGCCPAPTSLKLVNADSALALAARNLSLAEEKELDIVTICSGCTNTLRETKHILSVDDEKRRRIQNLLGRIDRDYEGGANIYNLPDFLCTDELLDRFKSEATRSLAGMKIGTHYGCHYFRPTSIMQDNHRDPLFPLPESMEIILETLGAEIVEYNRPDLCCGAALKINGGRNVESLEIAEEKLAWMNEAGIEALVVPCPTCFIQFDTGQMILNRRGKTLNTFPVLHIAELIAYALGAPPELLNLQSHKIPASLLT